MATTKERKQVRSGYDPGNKGYAPINPNRLLPGGTLAFADSSGLATDETDGGSNRFLGVTNNTADASEGDEGVDYARDGAHLFAVSGGVTQADLAKPVYAVDNDTLSKNSSAGPFVGSIAEVVDANFVMISINPNHTS